MVTRETSHPQDHRSSEGHRVAKPVTFTVIRDGADYLVADASFGPKSAAMIPAFHQAMFTRRYEAERQAEALSGQSIELRMIETPSARSGRRYALWAGVGVRVMSFERRTMTVRIFGSPDDFFDAVLGPSQHDAHVRARQRVQRIAADKAAFDAADERVRAAVQEINAQYRAHIAQMRAVRVTDSYAQAAE